MSKASRLLTTQVIETFMMAGNATLTLKSEKTGVHFTYRVRASEDGKVSFVSLMNGPDNEKNYSYLGTIRDGIFAHGAKSKIGADAPSAKAFTWFHNHLKSSTVPAQLQVWHEGRCGRCGRKLTHPESIERGIGPECAGLLG